MIPTRWFGFVVAGVLMSSLACGQDGADRYSREVADAIPHVEHAVGLKFKRPPRVEARTKAEVRAFLDKQFATSRAAHDLAGTEAAYKIFGLIPDTMNLMAEMKDVLAEQIVGFYDPKTKVLYVVDSAPQVEAGIVITHELVHALQDQYTNLDSLQNAGDDGDRTAAADAIIEGQAVFDQLVVMSGNKNFVAMIPGGWDAIRDEIRQNATMPAIAHAPMVLQETLIFPYLSGAEFVHDFETKEPDKQPFSDLPISTRQILHPLQDYFGKRAWPLYVTLPPLPRGLTAQYSDDMGEFGSRLFLYQHLHDQAPAIRGASGWVGDRYAVVKLPEGPALTWVTVWETPVAAAQFRELLLQANANRYGAHPKRTLTVTPTEVDGHPTIIFEDKPQGVTERLVNPTGIKVAEEK